MSGFEQADAVSKSLDLAWRQTDIRHDIGHWSNDGCAYTLKCESP